MPAQFSDFYNSLAPDPAKRGKQFERFVLWFLKADPEWATQVDQVCLVMTLPTPLASLSQNMFMIFSSRRMMQQLRKRATTRLSKGSVQKVGVAANLGERCRWMTQGAGRLSRSDDSDIVPALCVNHYAFCQPEQRGFAQFIWSKRIRQRVTLL